MFWLGSGAVRGFAVTLGLCILTSMFTAVYVTRLIVSTADERYRVLAASIANPTVRPLPARRGAWSTVGGDPVPQALVITAIVVAFAATAMAVALVLRLLKETGESTLDPIAPVAPVGASPERRES